MGTVRWQPSAVLCRSTARWLSKHLNLSLLLIWLKMRCKWWQKKFKGQNKLKAFNGAVCVLPNLPWQSGTDIAIVFQSCCQLATERHKGVGSCHPGRVTEEQLLLSSLDRHCQRVTSSTSQGQVFQHDTAEKHSSLWMAYGALQRRIWRHCCMNSWTWPVNVCF